MNPAKDEASLQLITHDFKEMQSIQNHITNQ